MSRETLAALEGRIAEQIPLTRHLGFRLLQWRDGELLLEAPLEPNINDKGTMFAGSQSALLALGGWALTTLLGEEVTRPLDVVAVRSELEYRAPLTGQARIRVLAAQADHDRFRERLTARSRASLPVTATAVGPDDAEAAFYKGIYVARQQSA